MHEAPLEPIRSPLPHLVRELCARVLPVGTFLVVLTVVAMLWRDRFGGVDVEPPAVLLSHEDSECRCAGKEAENEPCPHTPAGHLDRTKSVARTP